MSSLLRSNKFVRYIAGFARNVAANSPRDIDTTLVNNIPSICGAIPRSLATEATAQHDQSVDRSLKRIDQDVRKSGRISRRDIEEVLEEIKTNSSATSSQSLILIRCCGGLVPEEPPEIRTQLVQQLWNTLLKLNVPMDISHYNALLRVYLENEYTFSPTEFLQELELKGIEPNRVTYQRLISRYCQVGDIEGATKILEFMREKQLPVNENVFNALIDGHSQTGDMDSARGILNVMTQAGLEPTTNTYTTLSCGFARQGDIESIQKIFQECEQKDVLFLDKDYLEIIYCLAVNGHSEHIPFILSKVRKAIGYNQDAINLCLRLINKGNEDDALLVLKSMVRSKSDGTVLPSGGFFIKQLIKADRPVEKIIDICTHLENEQLHERALTFATEWSLSFANEKLAYPLLAEIQKRGLEIRQHYFWPLLASKSNDPTDEETIKVLLEMRKFNVSPTPETLREYVIPNLKGNSIDIIAKLREGNISVGVAASSLLHTLLIKHDIEEAAVIVSSANAYYRPDSLKKPLTSAFYKTNDLESYITIIRSIHDNLDRRAVIRNEDEASLPVEDKATVVGSLVIDLTSNPKFEECIANVLKKLVDQGLSISTTAAEKIQGKLGEKMTDEVSSLLGKLTSGELTPVPIVKKTPSYVPSHQMNIPQLERLIENLDNKKEDTKHLKRQLFTLYYRAKDIQNIEKMLPIFENDDSSVPAGVYAQAIDVYACHNNVEKAAFYLNKLREVEPEACLDDVKIIRFSQAHVNNGNFDEGLKILEELPRNEDNTGDRSFSYSSLVWRYLNSIAEKGQADYLDKLFDVLLKKEFISVNNMMLGPLIKVHLVNNDIDKALEKFEWCVKKFQTTPWKNELACRLIQNEDAEKLQELTDLSTKVHGEINSLYDLVFAFLECGRIKQARKILETEGLQYRPKRINSACERYRQEGLVKPLENLRDATKDLNNFDRSDIYHQLLLTYIKQEDVEKALELWVTMQEDDLQPSDEFLNQLGMFLSSKNIQVPFGIPTVSVPEKPTIQESKLRVQQSKPTVKQPEKLPIQIFRQKLKSDNIDEALNMKNQVENDLSVADKSILIEKLVQNERLHEATKLVLEMLDQSVIPVARVFKFLMNRLASSGDVDTLNIISEKISPDIKKLMSFDNKLCHAKLVAGQAEQYLDELESKIEKASESDLKLVAEQFPRGGAYGILEKHPELVPKFENLALKNAEKGIISPINVLWTYHFINGNDEKAEQLWTKHLKGSPRIMFHRIVQTARDDKNEELIKKLIDHLKISNVTEGAIGNAYSCYFDVLVANDKLEKIVSAFENAVNDINIDHINRTAVLRVKEVYNKLGKPFVYRIPLKSRAQTSTSSTSSSEEENQLKNK